MGRGMNRQHRQRKQGDMGAGDARSLNGRAGLLAGGEATALCHKKQQQGGQGGQWVDGRWGDWGLPRWWELMLMR